MPRARVPNASFFASADSLCLPFLAPRVFAESPIRSRSNQHHGSHTRTQKEKETVDGSWRYTRQSDMTSKVSGPWQNSEQHLCSHIPVDAAGALLKTFGTQWKFPTSKHLGTSAGLRYADISTFARRHIRHYSNGMPIARRVTSRVKRAPSHVGNVLLARKPSLLNTRGPLLAARREKALALERSRLANFLAHEPKASAADAFKTGRYRSLRSRIANLQQWDATLVDLRRFRLDSRRSAGTIRPFVALDRKIYETIRRRTHRIRILHHPRYIKWSARLFQGAENQQLDQVMSKWLETGPRDRKAAFMGLLVYLLDRKPGRALTFIQVLANDSLLRGIKEEAIADALGHLSRLHSGGLYAATGDWSEHAVENKRNFAPAFVHIYHTALAEHRHVCSQDLLYNMVNVTKADDLKKVFDCLHHHRAYMGFDTVLHYANAFAKAGEMRYALRCLQKVKEMSSTVGWETVVGRERLRWSCALLLRTSMSENHEYHETPGIVAAIVGMGIKMDTTLYNVVMHNAMDAGDYATAFKVFNALEGNGLKADKYTYSILLHGCASQSNPAMFSQFAEHCAEVAKDTQDVWLATEYLYYLYIRHQTGSDKAHNRDILLHAYIRFFDATPLKISPNLNKQAKRLVPDKQPSSVDSAELQPPPVALYIVLQSQIQAALATSDKRVLNLYTRFKLFVQKNNDPIYTALAQNPTIWNAFLLAFCQKQQFASASQLIKDMTDGSPQPNIYTWNIFMQAFFKTGQVQAAERVFEILRSRGIDPDQYTYGVLLRGYAKAQHVERIGETMQHVEAEQEMEPDLLRMLAQVVNRGKLMSILEESRINKDAKAKIAAAETAKTERKRWEIPRFTSDKEYALRFLEYTEDSALLEHTKEPVRGELDLKPVTQTFERKPQALDPDFELELERKILRLKAEEEQYQAKQDAVEQRLSITALPSRRRKAEAPLDSKIAHEELQDERNTTEQISSKQPPPTPPPSPAPSQPNTQNRFDPEVTYRKLQEELGLVAPSKSIQPPGNPPAASTPGTSRWHKHLRRKQTPATNDSTFLKSKEVRKFTSDKLFRTVDQVPRQKG
jgi:pentatricopeptide repeat protein